MAYLCALGRRELAARCCGLKKSGRKLRMHEIAGGEMRVWAAGAIVWRYLELRPV